MQQPSFIKLELLNDTRHLTALLSSLGGVEKI